MSEKLRFKNNQGEYPEWEEKTLGEVFEIARGTVIAKSSINQSKDEENFYPVYSSQSLNGGVMGWTNSFRLQGEKIMWTTDGANAGTVSFRKGKYNCTNVCGILTAKEEYEGYANSAISTAFGLVSKKFVSYVGNPKLMSNIVEKIKISFPSFPEQEKIAGFLSALDDRIDLQSQKIDLLKQQKKGYVQRLFSQQMRFTDDNGQQYPDWEEKTLGDITNSHSSNLTLGGLGSTPLENSIPVYSATGLAGYTGNSKIIPAPYFTIIKDGAGVGRVHKSKANSYFIGTLQGITQKGETNIDYLFYLFQVLDLGKTFTGSTIPHIYYKDYSKLSLQVPSLPEQENIANFLSALDNKIELEEQKLETYKLEKKGYMQRIFAPIKKR